MTERFRGDQARLALERHMPKQADNPQIVKAEDLTGLRGPKCDYELTGLTKTQCPECGGIFELADLRSGSRCKHNLARRSARETAVISGTLLLLEAATGVFALLLSSTTWRDDIAPVIFIICSGVVMWVAQPLCLFFSLIEFAYATSLGAKSAKRYAIAGFIFSSFGIVTLYHLTTILLG